MKAFRVCPRLQTNRTPTRPNVGLNSGPHASQYSGQQSCHCAIESVYCKLTLLAVCLTGSVGHTLALHSQTVPDLDRAIVRTCGEVRVVTAHLHPEITHKYNMVRQSQTLTVPSSEHVAKYAWSPLTSTLKSHTNTTWSDSPRP